MRDWTIARASGCVLRLLPALLLLGVSSAALPESLVAVTTDQVVPLPTDESVARVLVIEGRPIAVGDESTWLLGTSEEQWQQISWRPKGQILSVTGAYLILGAEIGAGVTGVTKLSLQSESLHSSALPSLPIPFASAHGAFLDDRLYVAGTAADGMGHLFSIAPLGERSEWTTHEAWPEIAGAVSSVVAQNSTLLVTVTESDRIGERMLQWKPETGWKERSELSGSVVDGSGRAIGQGHAIYLAANFQGNSSALNLVSFRTTTGVWANHGEVDATDAGTGMAWKDGILWVHAQPSGSAAEFSFAQIDSGLSLLEPLDWGVISVYLLGMLGVGLYFYRRDAQKSEAEFFLGGRSIPFWAAGISLYVSNASSISYIAIPAKAFETNWQYLLSNVIVVLGLMFVAVWIVPLLRRLNLMSIFQYLETRFHPSIRLLSSALYIVFQLAGRMTIILFLPSLAISTVTGIDVVASILIMGGVTILYTVLGGMKAVIWTDFLQLFVMFGGMFFAIAFVIMKLDGGTAEFLSTAMMDDKFKMVDWSFDLTEATIWGFVFLVLFDTVLTFPKDQILMQRVLATSSAKNASRSVWTFALIVLPASVIFYLIGTALYVFYQSHPERMDPTLTIDATFPLFIAAELPVGVTGLIIAGIFAASMSTLSSILNSVATLTTVDFYEKIVRKSQPKRNLRFAEMVTVVAGLIGIGLALLLSRYEIHSLLDLALELWGLLGGGFAGAYTLGMFTRRSNWQGVAIGVAVSIAVTLFAWTGDMLHPYFYLPVSICVCIAVGYAASWLFPAPSSLQGLTVFHKDAVAESPDSSPA